jgi:hypothetical protein
VNKGRIFLAANERISIPFRYRLPDTTFSSCSELSADGVVQGDLQQQQQQQQQQQERAVAVEFVPLELDCPVNILQLKVRSSTASQVTAATPVYCVLPVNLAWSCRCILP